MGDSFDTKRGIRDISLVIDTVNPETLPNFKTLQKALDKAQARLAFLWTPETISSALDTFPLEFLNFHFRHEILVGTAQFPWADFQPELSNLRLQCERELRGLSIHLQREVLLAGNNAKGLQSIFQQTLPHFIPIFCGIQWMLQNGRYPESDAACLEFIDSQWQLGNLFSRLARSGLALQELRWLASDYIISIEKIVKTVDRWETP